MPRLLLPALVALALASVGRSQQAPPASHMQRPQHHSGPHDGAGDLPRLVHEHVVHVPGARWLRLHFGESELGRASWLRMGSLADGGEQVLRTRSLRQWHGSSAIFNGVTVVVQLYAAPGDAGVSFELEHVLVGDPAAGATKALCGADDRVPSTDNRVGRLFLGGCTAWRATNGAFLTGGHCVSTFQPGDVVEFNVPLSLPDGTPVAASPDDQYPVDVASVVWNLLGKGNDWAVFGVFPNPGTGLLPHQAYGLGFRTSRETPMPLAAAVRITGFGLDTTPAGSSGGENERNHTNQTSTGVYIGEGSSGSDRIWIEYNADTTSGNSGGPVIWDAHDMAIGIHTNSACDSGGSNSGTSFELDELELALHAFPGPLARYVDVGHPYPASPDGSILRPFLDVATGIQNTPAGGILSIVSGSYGAVTVTSALTLSAPMGGVVLGN